ncbi:MAG TPA: hypothetical protein PL168_01375 [Methanobacterium sp.]|jgi:hypothetical protein|nr:hypothetical protein [Methanobacterium sp.]HOI39354.1 hypothetical protein [Methanobacterium sp.]
MNLEINYYWGMLGILGFLGYILENPVYYVFFIFFLLFLIPVYSKKKENNLKEENNKSKEKSRPSSTMGKTYNLQNVSIWLGSAALMFSGLTLMITKTMNDILSVILLLGIMAMITNFFTYVGMDKKAQDERLRKIGTYATTYSWYITLVFVSFLLINMYWAQNIHNPLELMGVIIFIMTSTMLIANTILSRKGDID